MIAIARSWGIPARYVSGYLHVSGDGGPIPGNATHAWAECLLPGAGWVGFDPTNRVWRERDTYASPWVETTGTFRRPAACARAATRSNWTSR